LSGIFLDLNRSGQKINGENHKKQKKEWMRMNLKGENG